MFMFELVGLTRMDHRVLCNYTELRRIGLDDFELDCSHTTAEEERVTLANGTVRCKSLAGKREGGM
jgi:hypothetical protein